ncbi:hypothetical protein [Pedobacter aquatilis]|uniref:hypothetical protein n=1 Tax=Pedobacter aquatilis TaxID=351343 RepID=UPI0029315B1C|nr:hypothetical protein [Pedobacter aquatilis]
MIPIKTSKNLSISNKNQYIDKIFQSIIDTNHNSDDLILVISIEQNDISFREFSNFLTTIDHIYGRFYRKGFMSYAMSQNEHLTASEIRFGSLEIIIEDILKKLSVHNAIYFYLMIKYLPAAISQGTEIVKNLTESFKNYEDGRFIRIQRKSLSKELRKDALLKNLTDDEIKKLTRNLTAKYAKDKKGLKKAAKFAAQKLLDVQLRKRK